MRDLAVCPEEQIAVEMMHDLVIEEGYGSHRLATWLNDKGYKTKNGGKFTSSYVLRILKNPLNRGIISKGGVSSDPIPELRLVSDYKHFKVMEILEQRNGKNEEKRTIALTNRGQALLPGIICCAHCGCKLATSRAKSEYKRKDGTVYSKTKGRYICYHRSRGLNDCDGMSVYDSDRIDAAVMKVMAQIFSSKWLRRELYPSTILIKNVLKVRLSRTPKSLRLSEERSPKQLPEIASILRKIWQRLYRQSKQKSKTLKRSLLELKRKR